MEVRQVAVFTEITKEIRQIERRVDLNKPNDIREEDH